MAKSSSLLAGNHSPGRLCNLSGTGAQRGDRHQEKQGKNKPQLGAQFD
jgi:hypothetical protein